MEEKEKMIIQQQAEHDRNTEMCNCSGELDSLNGVSCEEIEPDYICMMREVMEERYSRPRDGWQITDIALCPSQRVFTEIDRIPITDNDLNIFSSTIKQLFIKDLVYSEKLTYEISQGLLLKGGI